MLIDDKDIVTPEALITEEILKAISRQTQTQIRDFNNNFTKIMQQIETMKRQTKALQTAIAHMDAQRKEMLVTQRKYEKALKNLKADKRAYNKALKKILQQKKALKQALTHLNIIKENKKQKERAAKEAAYQKKMLNAQNLPEIRNVSDSYKKLKTRKYRGKKTIAPLDNYRVVKKFGTYIDPIYKNRIYNESVSLKPKHANAKVKTVLNGTVVLAKNMPLLENVVIVEHSNHLHTIYAHLDKIAPGIKKGKRIKKGAAIGRISEELVFEVTQKNYHINPLQLIR